MELLFSIAAFWVGAIFGSFLNVVIHRYPRSESVVFPPSRCPHCGERIAWYDNVPVLSYLILRARCRRCAAPISSRYPLVELANGLFFLALFQRTGISIDFLLLAALVSMTVALIYIDAEIQILPDVIDLPGIALGITLAVVGTAALRSDLILALNWLDSIIGAVAGAGVILGIAALYYLARRIEGMGMGDSKMFAMIGAVLGWRPLYAVLLIACVAGATFGISMALITRRKDLRFPLPFGIFLGLAFLIVLFFGDYLFERFPVIALGR